MEFGNEMKTIYFHYLEVKDKLQPALYAMHRSAKFQTPPNAVYFALIL